MEHDFGLERVCPPPWHLQVRHPRLMKILFWTQGFCIDQMQGILRAF